MTERGPIEIPQHLIESVPSAGKYEEDFRRDYQIRTTAYDYGIPQASLQNATVHRYVSVMRDVKAAIGREEWPDPDRGSAAYQGLPETYLFYRAAHAFLEEAFDGRHLHVDEVGRVLDGHLRDLGVTTKATVPYRELRWRNRPPVTGLWTGASDEYPEHKFPVSARRPPSWWATRDDPLERTDREHLTAVQAEAQRLGLAPGGWQDPDAHETLSRLVYARQLVRETTELDGLPAAPGMVPAATDRLAVLASLMKLTVVRLEQQFRPYRLSRAEVIATLEPVAAALDERIVPLKTE